MTTLDRLLEQSAAPRLVKIDVEHAEAEVLRGAERLLREVRPVWLVELHGAEGQRAMELLGEAGYRVSALGKGHPAARGRPAGGPAHIVAEP